MSHNRRETMEYKIRRTDRKLESAGSVLEFYRDTMILPDGTEQKWDYGMV